LKLRLSPNIKCKVYKVLKTSIKSVRVKKVDVLIGDEEGLEELENAPAGI
jgi:hypothetical protein